MKSLKITFLFLIFYLATNAQSTVLDTYIQEAFANNEIMKQQMLMLEKSDYALKEASTYFSPKVALQGNYILANGGRTIDVPIGDLFNPVYNNLNQINNVLAPGSPQYPQLQNVSEQLNPNNFYNAYIRTTAPLLNAEIWYNRKIKKEQLNLANADVNIYKRELAKNIKIAYFNFLSATQANTIYNNALALVKESEKINQKLYDNGKENYYAVARAAAEVSKVESKLAEAKSMQLNTQAYFNFLLNKPFDAEIIADTMLLNNTILLPDASESTGNTREELFKLQYAKTINYRLSQLNNSFWIPKLGAQLDVGSQAFDFEYNKQSRYYLLGFSLDWNLFSGRGNQFKKKQIQVESKIIDSQTKYVTEQLKLASSTANNTYVAALQQYKNARVRESTSNQYFSLTDKKYKNGTAIYLEYLDAQNEKTNAALQKCLDYFNAWIKHAELERAQSAYNITQP